jgi:DeoR family fructose operon transcriptional repressor
VFAEERLNRIAELVELHGRVVVADLARHLKVSPVTIRKDLQDLEERGVVQRTHGGAILRAAAPFDPSARERATANTTVKAAIARLALDFVKDGDSIILDGGTTTLELARLLAGRPITVITNSVSILNLLLNDPAIELIATGGTLRGHSGNLLGPLLGAALSRFRVDTAFMGATGVTASGPSAGTLLEAEAKLAMLGSASRAVLLADGSKAGRSSLVFTGPWSRYEAWITDDRAGSVIGDAEGQGVQVLRVPPPQGQSGAPGELAAAR